MSNKTEFNPRRSARASALPLGFVLAFFALFPIAIMISAGAGPSWVVAAIAVAALVIYLLTRAVWRQEYTKEAEKSEWAMRHPLAIQAKQHPVHPSTDTTGWHYVEHSDSRGGGEMVMGLFFLGLLGFILATMDSLPPAPLLAGLLLFLLASVLLVSAGFLRQFRYRNLEMRITRNALAPGDSVRIVIRQPGRRPVPHLQVALISRLRDYGGEGISHEMLVVAPIIELRNVMPATDGRLLDFEFQLPQPWPRTQDFSHPVDCKTLTQIRLKQEGQWPGSTFHFPLEITEPAPSAIDIDWPLGSMRSRLKRHNKPASPAVTATFKAAVVFIVTGLFVTLVFGLITAAMPEDLSGLALAVWCLLLTGYVVCLTVIPYKVWRVSYVKAKNEWEAAERKP